MWTITLRRFAHPVPAVQSQAENAWNSVRRVAPQHAQQVPTMWQSRYDGLRIQPLQCRHGQGMMGWQSELRLHSMRGRKASGSDVQPCAPRSGSGPSGSQEAALVRNTDPAGAARQTGNQCQFGNLHGPKSPKGRRGRLKSPTQNAPGGVHGGAATPQNLPLGLVRTNPGRR